ncbi:MAG: hypothetical protein HQK51_04320 [Oligoflexia bacterium]|nr:hypothetical protein [Oligoflexia bacterium]
MKRKMKILKLMILMLGLCGLKVSAGIIDAKNNPDVMRTEGEAAYDRNFASLNTVLNQNGEAETSNPGWSDDYYAVVHGGIAVQFKGKFDSSTEAQASNETIEEFDARKARLDAVKDNLDSILKITESDISKMSKFNLEKIPAPMILDIKNKKFNYPLIRNELARTKITRDKYNALDVKKKDALKRHNAAVEAGDTVLAEKINKERDQILKDINKINWFGQCHGWAPVTVSEKEPNYCETNAEAAGIKLSLPVWSSDMKALVAHLAAHYSHDSTPICGDRCNTYHEENAEEALKDPSFLDINPGALHIVLSNKIGKLKKGFVLEVTSDAPVWNQGVVAYKILKSEELTPEKIDQMIKSKEIADANVAPGTVKQVYIENKVKYIVEVQPHKNAMGKANFFREATYKYILELDKDGNIIGGRYVGDSIRKHPDFTWAQSAINPFSPLAKDLFGQGMDELMKESAMKAETEQERIAREKSEQLEKERLEKERLEKEKLEKERLEKERLEKEKLEKERIAREAELLLEQATLGVLESISRQQKNVWELNTSDKDQIIKYSENPEKMEKMKALAQKISNNRFTIGSDGLISFIDWDSATGRCTSYNSKKEIAVLDNSQCKSEKNSKFRVTMFNGKRCVEYRTVGLGLLFSKIIRTVPQSVCKK